MQFAWRQLLALLLGAALAIYLSITLYIVIIQRSLIYTPKPLKEGTPRDFGIDYEVVSIEAIDAGKIYAWWVTHKGSDTDSSPVILYCHGNNAAISNYGEVASIFASYGWSLLIFDYRGFGESSKPTSGLNEESLFADAQSALGWLKRRGISEKRVIVWGHSLGSPIAAHLAANSNLAGAVLEGSFSSAFDMSRYRYPWIYIPEFLIVDQLATARYVKEIKIPLLVMHAELDRIIPFALGERVYAAANDPKQFLKVIGVGHEKFPSVHLQYKGRLVKFANDALSNAAFNHSSEVFDLPRKLLK